MKHAFLALVVVAMAFTACESNSGGNPAYPFLQSPAAESVDFVPGYASTDNKVFTTGMADSLRSYYMEYWREACLVRAEFNNFIINADTAWSWVHSEVQDELDEWTSHPFYYMIVNYVTNRMLWYHFLGGSSYTTAQKEAMQFYVNLALEYNNPDAEMMADALIILHENSFWSTARVKSAADSADGFADTYLSLSSPTICNCEDTTGSTSGYITDALNAKQSKHNLIIDAQDVLDSLATL